MNNEKLRFDLRYKREEWIEYLGEKFNYNVGVIPIEENIIEKYSDCLDNSNGDAIIWLGNLNIDEDIGVYEIKIKNTKLTTRVKISKICTDVIRTGVGKSYGKGIFFILYSNDSDEIGKYRISYVKYDKKANENLDIEKDLSNPKRFTYLLGEGAKVKTATSRLTKEAFTTVKKIEEAFSVEPVNEEFYKGIKKLFDKIYKDVLKNFNGNCPLSANETSAKEFSLRFLGRTLFCWFLREKDLIPKEIFDLKIFLEIKDNYYKEVLEELFFNVLNAKMNERKIVGKIIKKYEKQIPFLNGGLFAKQKDDDKVKTIDNEIIKELFEFFSAYNFTVDESTPFDIEISIDPEMLGRIFENLLVAIDTNKNFDIGNSTFYTPREIVDYMVKESIRLSLQNNTKNISEKEIEKIFNPNEDTKLSKKEIEELLSVLHEIKILDPACGSGAFPIGILQRVFMIIDKLDPNHEFYKELLLKNIKGQAKIEFEKLYESKKFDYAYKLYILQNMIHGVDIQPIAIEISCLRSFLSLIVEEEKNEKEYNLGIKPLPNLEFNFISANSLIPLEVKNNDQKSFNSMYVDGIVEKIKSISEDYFNASSEESKNNIKHRFEELRDFIINNDYLEAKDKEKFLSWNPFDNYTAMFFNPQIQFGIKDKFDIVIGNPPYVSNKQIKNEDMVNYKKLYGIQDDLYYYFYIKGIKLLKYNAILSYISSNSFLTIQSKKGLREILQSKHLLEIINTGNVFERAEVEPAIVTLINEDLKDYEFYYSDNTKEDNPVSKNNSIKININVFINSPNSIFFTPNEFNMQLYNKFIKEASLLISQKWDLIKTSRDIEKNQSVLENYRNSLKEGDITLLGLITEGGQGLATANNGKYVGVIENTKDAMRVYNQRLEKIKTINKEYNTNYDISKMKEKDIRGLFDLLKEKYGRDIFGQGFIYRIVSKNEIADINNLSKDEKENGIKNNKTFVPYDKGDKEGNKWYYPTVFAIDWSKDNVDILKKDTKARWQGYNFFFKSGFTWNLINGTRFTNDLKFKISNGSVYDVGGMTMLNLCEKTSEKFIICICNSNLINRYTEAFINCTVNFQLNDARQIPIIIPNQKQLKQSEILFDKGKDIKERRINNLINEEQEEKELKKLQEDVDSFVCRLYGVEKWKK